MQSWEYFLIQWKCAKIILLLKPDKPAEISISYRLISLFSIFSIKNYTKTLKKTFNKRFKNYFILLFWFQIKNMKHNRVELVHLITGTYEWKENAIVSF